MTKHSFRCRWCQQIYCSRCGRGGECETCRRALAGTVTGSYPPAIDRLEADRYGWRRAENHAFTVYIGQRQDAGLLASLHSWPVIVTDHAGTVLHQGRVGALQRLKAVVRR